MVHGVLPSGRWARYGLQFSVWTALGLIDGPSVLKAQSRLRQYYAGFGFEVTGPEFDEDGIAHVPMRLVT